MTLMEKKTTKMEKPKNRSIGRPVLKGETPAPKAAERPETVSENDSVSLEMPQPEIQARRSVESPRLRVGITPGDGGPLHYGALARLFSDGGVFESVLPFVYGSSSLLAQAAEKAGLGDMNVAAINQIQDIKGKRAQVLEPRAEGEDGDVDAYAALQAGIRHLAQGQLRVLVSLPLTDEEVRERHADFKNQAVAVAEIFSGSPFRLLLARSMRLSFLTTTAKQDTAGYLSPQRVEQRIKAIYDVLRSDFSITTPRIAVLSAAMQGRPAQTDTEVLKPVVDRLLEGGMPVFGPYAAQDFFTKPDHEAFDAVLCMYKEQAEMAFDILPKEDCCYYTAGLPIVHVEPVFGNGDTESAFRAVFRALCTGVDLDAARQQNMKLTENPLGYHAASYRRDSREEN